MEAPNLGDLWRQADRLGRVSVEETTFHTKGIFEAAIRFENSRGTVIWARGNGRTPEDALHEAIQEALRYGATSRGCPALT